MLAVLEAEHLDVADANGAACWRHVTRRAMKNAKLSTGERALLHGNIVDNVQVVHVDMRIGEGAEPATEELNTGRLSLAAQATRRLEGDIVRERFRKSLDVVCVEGFRPPFEGLSHGPRH